MTKANDRLNKRLNQVAAKSGTVRASQAEMMAQMTDQKNDDVDFKDIAAKLEARKKQEAKGENEGYIKDTIYIEETLYKSFNALCLKRGDKKKYTNQAIADFIKKKYKELQIEE